MCDPQGPRHHRAERRMTRGYYGWSIAYLGKKNGTAYTNSMKGAEVAVVTFKPEHLVSWDYAKESP